MLATLAASTVTAAGASHGLESAGAADVNAHSGKVRTWIFLKSGRRVGYVERWVRNSWWASDDCNSSVYIDRGRYVITEGFHPVGYASPVPGTKGVYRVKRGYVFRGVSETRWNVLDGTGIAAFTRGPDGVPAALAFATWYGVCSLP